MITEEVEFDNRQRGDGSLDSQSPSEPVATFMFDKNGIVSPYRKYYLSAVIILATLLAFGLGRLSVVGEREGIKVEFDPALTSLTSPIIQTASSIFSLTTPSEAVYASKNGKKYHFPDCPGAKQISEANKIVFESPKAAEASGYTLASNCKR